MCLWGWLDRMFVGGFGSFVGGGLLRRSCRVDRIVFVAVDVAVGESVARLQ